MSKTTDRETLLHALDDHLGRCACQSYPHEKHDINPPCPRVKLAFAIIEAGFLPAHSGRITIRHEQGNTLSGTVEQVLSTHLAKGWALEPTPEAQP